MRGKAGVSLGSLGDARSRCPGGCSKEGNMDCGEDLKKTSLSLLSEWVPSPIAVPLCLMLTSHSGKEI